MPSASSILFVLFACLASMLCTVATPVQAQGLESRAAMSGRATYFYVGLGNCGIMSKDTDYIVALATKTYSSGAHCGKKIKIQANGKTATAIVMDSCPSCSAGDLDLSPSLFQHFDNLNTGVLSVKWWFV